MTLQQTVTIPADRRLHFDLPLPWDTPIGEADVKLIITLHRGASVPLQGMAPRSVSSERVPLPGKWVNPLLGIAKDASLTVERFMEMQEEEIDLENEYAERQRLMSAKYRSRGEP
jgi:hypothetical protein